MTYWQGITRTSLSWVGSDTDGRHTLGQEYNTTTRIRLGDNVRIGGVENLDTTVRTSWS